MTQRIAATVDKNLRSMGRLREIGSIEGRLDVISVHDREIIKVWDSRTFRPVECRLGQFQLEEAKEFLRQRVVIRGIIEYKARKPIAVLEVFDIRRLRRVEELPQPETLEPIDLFGSADPADYLRDE